MTERAKDGASALGKAVMILEALFEEDRPMGPAELSARMDLPRPTVHRLIRQLEDNDLVRRDFARDHFTVGARLLNLGVNALSAAFRAAPMRLILKSLVDEIGETCNIGVLDHDEVLYLDRVECDWPLRLQLQPGSHVPAHATAIGKMLLAHLPSRTRKRVLNAAPLQAYTANTVTDPETLEREFKQIRRRGYAINNSEQTIGLIALAVPIFDKDGRVVAGLAVHAPDARMNIETAEEILPALRACAAKLQNEISETFSTDHETTGLNSSGPTPVG